MTVSVYMFLWMCVNKAYMCLMCMYTLNTSSTVNFTPYY